MKLQKVKDGYRWEDSPVFYGPDARHWAIVWGKTQQYLDDLRSMAALTTQRKQCTEAVEQYVKAIEKQCIKATEK